VNLAEDTPRLNLPKGLKLLEGATLNPLFSDKFGRLINNPLFVDASQAKGLVNITVLACERLPLDTLVLKNAPENDGHAEFQFSIQDVYLGNSKLLEALKLAGQQSFAESMQGDIRDSRVAIGRGATQQNLIFNIGERDRPLRIEGTTVLETSAISMDVTLPPQLLKQMGQFGREVLRVYPEGLPIPVGGTATAPRPDFQRAIANVQKDLVPGLLEGLLNRGNKQKDRPSPAPDRGGETANRDDAAKRDDAEPDNARPAPPAPSDPLKDLLDAVGKKIDERDKPKNSDKNKRKQKNDRKGSDAPSGSDRISRDPPAAPGR
jgi:hypothetical protein